MNTGSKSKVRAVIGLTLGLLCAGPAFAVGFDTDGDYVGDAIDAHPCDPEASATAFAPGLGDHGMLLFEDQFPNQGDFDFNDVAVTYNYVYRLDRQGRVISMRATFNVLAVGGDYHNGLGLRIPMSAREIRRAVRVVNGVSTDIAPSSLDADATFFIMDDLRDLFADPDGIINADPTLDRQVGQSIEFTIVFDQGRVFPVSAAPYDIFVYRTDNPSIEIHRPEFRGTARMDITLFGAQDDRSDGVRNFVDPRGIPFALHFPTLAQYPLEGVSIDQLYPNIVPFGQSGGQQFQDFYVTPVQANFAYRDRLNRTAPSPVFVGSADLNSDTSCVPAWGLALQWGEQRSAFTYGGGLAPNRDALTTGYTRGNFPGGPNMGGLDGFVARYDSTTGAEIWMTQLATSGDDTGRDLAVDAAGFIYVVGDQSNGASGSWYGPRLAGVTDAFVTKLTPGGQILWTQVIASAGNDSGYGVDVDAAGNVYIVGFSSDRISGAQDPGGFPSSFVAKFDTQGVRQWVQQYRTDPAHPRNYSYNADIAFDQISGTFYVVGTERRFNRTPSAASNAFVTKHRSSDGTILWVNHIGDYGYWNGSLDGRYAHGFGVDVDDFDGSAYVTGSFGTGSHTTVWGDWSKPYLDDSPDAFFTRVSPTGQTQWSRTLASNGRGHENAEAVLASGVAGVVYFTGRTSGTLPGQVSRGGTDYYLAAFGYDGTQRWVVQGGTPQMDMGHLAASTACSQAGGTVYTIGNADVAAGSGTVWQTAFYEHDIATGANLSMTLVQRTDWSSGPWSTCSNTCGSGTHTRTVTCTQPDGTAAAPSACMQMPPVDTETCQGSTGCMATWQFGAWSGCSQPCGVGERSRTVTCKANGVVQPDSACLTEAEPLRRESCSAYDSCTYDWSAQTWGSCTSPAPCALGNQNRSAFCRRSDGTPVMDGLCPGTRPVTGRACLATSCSATNTSCASLLAQGTTTSGRYDIDPDGPGPGASVNVYCDMDAFGGGWTNLDFSARKVYLDASQYIECTGGLVQDANSITCHRPRFEGQENLPLYQFRCDGVDRSVDYVLDHVAPTLGHSASQVLGFTRLAQGQSVGGGTSSMGNEYCYAYGIIARQDHLVCAQYRVEGVNQQCVPGYFTLGL